MTEKHISKLWDKIFDAYGKNWKEHEIDDKTEEILESVKICCQKADLVSYTSSIVLTKSLCLLYTNTELLLFAIRPRYLAPLSASKHHRA